LIIGETSKRTIKNIAAYRYYEWSGVIVSEEKVYYAPPVATDSEPPTLLAIRPKGGFSSTLVSFPSLT